jgi:hypothetical protein
MQGTKKIQNLPLKVKHSAKANLRLSPFTCICALINGCFAILLLFLYGCGAFGPPPDYYQKTLEMEGYGEQTRSETGRHPGDVVSSPENQGSTKVIKKPSDEPPIIEVVQKTAQEKDETVAIAKSNNVLEQPEQKTLNHEFSVSPVSNFGTERRSEPIAVSSDVIRSALEIAGINVRSVELVNGRVESGKNSVRINFICESSASVNEKFFTICAVTYHLNKASKTIDVVIGIAEDSQANLLGVLQSNTEDITAWMDNKITRAEWFSRITRKML